MDTPSTAARLAALHEAFRKLRIAGRRNTLYLSPLPDGRDLATEEMELRVELRSREGSSALLRLTPRGARLDASSAHRTGDLGFSHVEDNLNVHLTTGFRWGDVDLGSGAGLARALLGLLSVRLGAVEVLESRRHASAKQRSVPAFDPGGSAAGNGAEREWPGAGARVLEAV